MTIHLTWTLIWILIGKGIVTFFVGYILLFLPVMLLFDVGVPKWLWPIQALLFAGAFYLIWFL